MAGLCGKKFVRKKKKDSVGEFLKKNIKDYEEKSKYLQQLIILRGIRPENLTPTN